MYWDSEAGVAAQVARFEQARREHTRGRVRATSVKIFQDGVLETGTAALLEPYLDAAPGFRGELLNAQPRLDEAVTRLDALGFQLHFHAIGDAAIRSCLDAIEAARRANGSRDARHHVSHLELVDPADIPRFASLGVVANFQPLWAYADGYITDLTLPRIGPARGRWLYPMASFRDAGVPIAFGSDWSVSSANPLLGIETAVTRMDATGGADAAGTAGEPFLPQERLTLADAIASYTIGSARVNFLDRDTGSIEVGKLADLVVLDRNPFAIPPAEISEVRVVATLLEGELVHGELP
jgi:predicted amidohydrolase YtcJ